VVWSISHAEPLYLKEERLVVYRDDQHVIECYAWRTRKRLWSYSVGASNVWIEGAIERGGRFYWVSYDIGTRTDVLCLSMADGKLLAERAFDGSRAFMPACDGPLVFFGCDHWMHALDARTLQRKWACYDAGNVSPMRVGGWVVTQGYGHWVTAVSVAQQRATWRHSALRGSAHNLTKGRGGSLLVVEALEDPPVLAGIDVATGKIAWRNWLSVSRYGNEHTTAGCGRFVYATGINARAYKQKKELGGFYCLEGATGRLRWRYERHQLQ